jgi:hypothetical protein
MKLFNLGVRGGLKKVNKLSFKKNEAYLIDDYKIIYLWFGSAVPEKQIEYCKKKAKKLSEEKDPPIIVQIQEQDKEYGSFLAIIEILKKGIAKSDDVERRPELEIEYDETIELIEAGLDPDLEGEITIAAHKLMEEKKSYDELCISLAKLQLKLLGEKSSQKKIKEKSEGIRISSSTYEELCWLIAELGVLINKKDI